MNYLRSYVEEVVTDLNMQDYIARIEAIPEGFKAVITLESIPSEGTLALEKNLSDRYSCIVECRVISFEKYTDTLPDQNK